MSYEYIPTDTKFCDSSSCDECEDLELLSTNKEHDDTKENLLESADESLLEIETGVPSTNKTILKPKHDETKVNVADYSNRVQGLEKQIKDTIYNIDELEKATRTEIKEFIEQFNSKDKELQESIDDNKESLLEIYNNIDSLTTELEEQVDTINTQIESLPQNSQVIETYTRLNVLEEAITNIRSELEELSQAGNEELLDKVNTLEEQLENIDLALKVYVETWKLRFSRVEPRLDTIENQLKDIITEIQELPTTTTDSEIYERLESLEDGLADLIEYITDLPTTEDISRLNRINQSFEGRLNFLSSQYEDLKTQLENLPKDSQSSDLESRVDSIEEQLDDIRSSVDIITNEELESILI